MTITKNVSNNNCITTFSYKVSRPSSIPEENHTLLDTISFQELSKITDFTFEKPTSFYPGGWQSWDAAWEIPFGKKQPVYKKFAVPQFQRYIEVPGNQIKKTSNTLLGQFIIYFRTGSTYLVLASTGAFKSLPPVQYAVNLKNKTVLIYAYANGKIFSENEDCGEIKVFCAKSFHELKDTIHSIYFDDRFNYQKSLTTMPGGYESWYNHYNKIDQNIITSDLESLNKTENIINQYFITQNKPTVFQIDDGWQFGTGQWDVNLQRFPQGLSIITKDIEEKGYIPGLWIAPFICDFRLPFVQEHKDWLLKDKNGKYIQAGYNPSWGAKKGPLQPGRSGSYYAWDISISEVISHLDSLMDKIINEWGFRYIKLDFLFAGLLLGAYRNGGAAYEHYGNAISIITKRKTNNQGLPVYYLGCGMSFECSFRYLPLSRIGTDTLEHWDRTDLKLLSYPARPSAYINLKDTLAHAFWNNSVFQNDPDVIFIRNTNCTLTDQEKLLIAFVNFAFGSQIMYSDDPLSFSDAEIPLTSQICDMYKKFENTTWELSQNTFDFYTATSTDGRFTVTIDLKNRCIKFL